MESMRVGVDQASGAGHRLRGETQRYLQCLAADEQRLREVAARDLAAAVPSCPEWTVHDLVEHVALVYLHKVECMRSGAPAEWPPQIEPGPPIALLDRAYAALLDEFAQRGPDAASYTWYSPEQTVGFWMRRMAQETVIHRVDAELALGEPLAAVPDDLAVDGIDEVLERFLGFGSVQWREDFGPELTEADGSAVLVTAGGREWLVRMEPSGVRVEPSAGVQQSGGSGPPGGAGSAGSGAVGRLSGDPQSVLLWLWRRTDASAVTYEGDPQALGRLRELLGTATQ
jgi:uncharacterized protein (TIGR03083 family)